MTLLSSTQATAHITRTSGLPGFTQSRPEPAAGSSAGGSLFAQLLSSLEQAVSTPGDRSMVLSARPDGMPAVGNDTLENLAEELLQAVNAEGDAGLPSAELLDQVTAFVQDLTTEQTHEGHELQQMWMAFLKDMGDDGRPETGRYAIDQGFTQGAPRGEKRLPASLQGLTRGEMPREFVTIRPVPGENRPLESQTGSVRPGAAPFELFNALVRQQEVPEAAARPGNAELRVETGGASPASVRAVTQEWAPVRVDTRHDQWARDLASALGERLNMQISQQVREATVRLDPPELGKIELIVRMDGDRLNVQLNAASLGVRDMLMQHVERLRMDLLAQNLQTVDVHVGEHGQRDGSREKTETQPVIAENPDPNGADPGSDERKEDRWLSTSA